MSRRATRHPGAAVVIGGGVAGLASAALLAHDGWSVDLVERHERPGGRAGVWEHDGFRFDTGPSWYLMPEVFEHFFRLLGTSTAEQLDLVRLDPAYRVFFEGYDDPLDLRSDQASSMAAFDALEPGAGSALDAYLDDAREVYRLAVRRFLYSTFESKTGLLAADVLRRGPRLGALLTRSLESHVAARFTDHRLRQVLGYPAVFLGTSPDRAPSMYSLMSSMDLADGVHYPRGGFGTLVDALTRLAVGAGVRLHLATEATAVEVHRGASGARVSGVTVAGQDGRSDTLPADLVVGAGDLHHLETTLVPDDLRTYPAAWWRSRDPGPGAVLACLGVRGTLPQLAHHSLFFTRDWRRNFDDIFDRPGRVPQPASAYVCRPSATDPTVAPAGHENVFVLVPVPADPGIGHGGRDGAGDPEVEKVADAAIAQVAEWASVPDLTERIVVRRTVGPADFATDLHSWSGGALGPAHVLRQSAFFRAGNASKRIDGLLYAGASTIPGIGLPMCLISAELVLKRTRGDRSTSALPEPVAR
ncbi:phytoene desaturase family protein [Nocardioides sp. CER19]|uniref:phytoene desaturase family protein n=1 Tax=Nocardioides sp. CER19 TaxID=3038538 RepID=UPI00244B3AEA|nr:phytoene desaturase family protein [Nocardioides sp. CER19]MDH2416243.1 phytoene desaturase family protein [Nocardioides sp. CER19]